jgi:hypothetical protein
MARETQRERERERERDLQELLPTNAELSETI